MHDQWKVNSNKNEGPVLQVRLSRQWQFRICSFLCLEVILESETIWGLTMIKPKGVCGVVQCDSLIKKDESKKGTSKPTLFILE